MEILTFVLQLLLGLLFLYAGGSKLVGTKDEIESFQRWGFPQWFRLVTGALQLLGVVGLVAGIWYPALAVVGGVWLGVIMLGAVLTLLTREPAGKRSVPPAVPFVLMLLAVVVAGLRFTRM